MAFPTSPTNGQTAVLNGINYIYASSTNSWTRVPSTLVGTAIQSVSANTQSISSILIISNTTPSLTNTSGSLIVNGGAGISGNVYIGGIIVGGSNNISSTSYSTIVGGQNNLINANGGWAFLGGGQNNLINAYGGWGFIGSGYNNTVSSNKSSIVGGELNIVTGADAIVAGGQGNNQSGTWSGVLCGLYNVGGGYRTFIGSGYANKIYAGGDDSSIVGGYSNQISGGSFFTGNFSFIGGGRDNLVYDGLGGSIAGGRKNQTGIPSYSQTVPTFNTYGTSNNQITVSSSYGINPGDWIDSYGKNIYADTFVIAVNGTTLILNQNTTAIGSGTNLGIARAYNTVAGGYNNIANGSFSFVGGGGGPYRYDLNPAGSNGVGNAAGGNFSAIVGGQGNLITIGGDHSFIGGGGGNFISASDSVICGGGFYNLGFAGNKINGSHSFIGGGFSNLIQYSYSFIGSGYNNTVNGFEGFIGAGDYNSVSYRGVVLGGFFNNANGNYSVIKGGSYGTTRGINYSQAYSASQLWAKQGSAQLGTYILTANTSTATANTMVSDGVYPAVATNQIILPVNSAYYFKGSVIGTVTGGGNTGSWSIEGAISQGATASTTRIVGTANVISIAKDSGVTTNNWNVAVTANTTLGCLQVSVTGDTTNIRWVSRIETTEVTF